jgi:DHA1 family tetracycline resistance protein-like MFS transporter
MLTVFLTVFIDLLGVTIVIPILAPLLVDSNVILGPEFSASDRNITYGFLSASFSFFQFFSAPFLGTLSDKYGRRQVLKYSLFLTLFGYLIFTVAIMQASLIGLFIGRALSGIASGNMAVIYSAIADLSEPEEKAKNFGLVGMAFGLGFVIGPVLGGLLSSPEIVSWFDYETPFLFSALLVALNILLVYVRFPETLTSPNPEASISPLNGFKNIRKAFNLGSLRWVFLSVFLMFFGFSFFTQFFQIFLIGKFQFGPDDIGYLFGYIGIAIALTQGLLVRVVSKRFMPRKVLVVSILGLVGALLILLVPDTVLMLYLVIPGVALFQGLSAPNFSAIISNSAPANLQGETLGIQQSMQSVANMVPPVIGGFAVSFAISFPIWLAALSTLLAWLVFMFGVRRKQQMP